MSSRAISEDGSRIVFESAEPLSPVAVNDLTNVYEWHEGAVSLVSGGSASVPVSEAVITPSGNDVFFVTTESLLAQDTDDAADIYDARMGVGFLATSAERQPCSGDACQGPLTNPVPLLAPGSATQAQGENLPSTPAMRTVIPKKLTRAQQLTSALKACAKKPKRKRATCRSGARKKYATPAKSAIRGWR